MLNLHRFFNLIFFKFIHVFLANIFCSNLRSIPTKFYSFKCIKLILKCILKIIKKGFSLIDI
jgi:hypothetical protein